MNIQDGGSAFPIHKDYLPDSREGLGMSLRDYFAGQVMTFFSSDSCVAAIGKLASADGQDRITYLAAACYGVADAMLKAREAR